MSIDKLKRILSESNRYKKVTPEQLIKLFYNICVENSTLPDKLIDEITQIETLRAKIDSEVIKEYLEKIISFEDFKQSLWWMYDINDQHWGGSRSTKEIDDILNTRYNIRWLSDELAEITKK